MGSRRPAKRWTALAEPAAKAEKVEILEGFPPRLVGRLAFLPQTTSNTTESTGKDYTYREDMTREMMAKVVMENYDPEFAARAQAGDVVVGGFNFGTGSSREQAVTALQAKGIPLVIAGSFSQTYLRNAFNNGFLCIETPALVRHLREVFAAELATKQRTVIPGDEVAIDFTTSTLTYRGRSFVFPALGSVPQSLVIVGGVENLVRKQLGKIGGAALQSVSASCTTAEGGPFRTRLPSAPRPPWRAVAEGRWSRCAHVHQFVDSENDEDRLDWQVERGGRPEQDDERRPRDTRHALAGEHQVEDHQELLAEPHVNPCRLGDEHRGERKVERGAVEVETVPRRITKRDDLSRHAIASMASIARGSAASDDVVANASDTGSATAAMNLRIGTRAMSATGRNTTRMNTIRARLERRSSLARFHQDSEAHVADGVRDRGAHLQIGAKQHGRCW